jgi:hypothetical protein
MAHIALAAFSNCHFGSGLPIVPPGKPQSTRECSTGHDKDTNAGDDLNNELMFRRGIRNSFTLRIFKFAKKFAKSANSLHFLSPKQISF